MHTTKQQLILSTVQVLLALSKVLTYPTLTHKTMFQSGADRKKAGYTQRKRQDNSIDPLSPISAILNTQSMHTMPRVTFFTPTPTHKHHTKETQQRDSTDIAYYPNDRNL